MVETRVFESDLLGRHLVTIEQLYGSLLKPMPA